MDQGSVVVLCRRGVVFIVVTYDILQSHPVLDRDLYYSGLNPAVTTSDPRSDAHDCCRVLHRIRDQFGLIAQRRTIVGVMYYNQKLSRYFEFLIP